MFQYLCISTTFYTIVFNYFYGTMDERSFDDCAASTRKFSMVHLALCIPLATLAMYTAPCVWCVDTLFHRQHSLYEIALMNTCGYFLVDLYVLYRNWFKYGKVDGGYFMVVHHLSTIVTYYNVYVTNQCQHLCALFLLNEVSTVFLNLVHFYAKRPRLRILCGMGLLVSFFIFRIYMFAQFNLILFSNWHRTRTLVYYLKINILMIALVFSMMNLFWFQKICSGFAKALRKRK